jgi:hypothetical protein
MIFEGIVNSPSNISFSDGDDAKILLGKTGEQMFASQHENVYSLAYRGKVFHGYSTTSVTIPITSTTSPTFILWNPTSSGINLIPIEYAVGWESGTNTEGNIQFGVLTGLQSTTNTGGPISAFTAGPVINGLIGGGEVYKAKFGIAATIVAATKFFPLGMNIMVLAAAKATPVDLKYPFGGKLILSPGTAIFSCASAATVAKYHERLTWYEWPI